ncbi:threonine ammonia-lyase [Sulfuracidifex metallicus]|uniref:threonine ammonia-lyase n=1 Tax=Sulfuracidifex metallicus DSM 6482 = JCM 9184 TaxID=523847 RepID=A0A6A9QN76_SULME|nr:threonine ammonia-lyase [Sulfuracidifex metallicus]MUN28641.1 threonine ammonia-lyase [Sulfuracidifex metallicus DSM 6482 = JCM 9184]WOE52020.1 threonine ammonia-lyase [Sulfuracidifex metallicus DSM 6482 = JCM 9184]
MKYVDLFEKVREAKERISPYIHETPVEYSTTFSRRSGSDVFLKLENFQKTGSFKVRGAFNKLLSMMPKDRSKGVIAVSAGNHAQGVAYASSTLGIKSTIIMPETAPISKYLATRSYGANVILYGRFLHEGIEKANEIMRNTGSIFIHPYDDINVILGQATLGLELLSLSPDVVVVPIGGGGLISGISIALKAKLPNVKIIGVQTTASPSMKISKESGKLISVEPSFSVADGILVKNPSSLTFDIINELVDDIVLVNDEEISETIFLLAERSKVLVEGAGAASLAAIINNKISLPLNKSKVVSIISGGNIDMSLFTNIIGKMLYISKRVVKIKVIVPDKPGYLNRILSNVVKVRGNIIDIVHDRVSSDVPPGFTKIYVTFEVPSKENLNSFINDMNNEGIETKFVE